MSSILLHAGQEKLTEVDSCIKLQGLVEIGIPFSSAIPLPAELHTCVSDEGMGGKAAKSFFTNAPETKQWLSC